MIRKTILTICLFTLCSIPLLGQAQKIKFVKGNITDKTIAVREASGEEGIWLSNEAIKFALENKSLLGNDRELEGLAVAAILSIPVDYLSNCSDADKKVIINQFMALFSNFDNSNTVQIAVLSKILQCKDTLPTKDFTKLLNKYITGININTADSSTVKAVLNSLEFIGDNESFLILYDFYNNSKYDNYKNDLKNAVSALIPNAMNEVIHLIHGKDINQISMIYRIVRENSKISKNFLSEIAENVLSESILIIDNSSKISNEIIELQLDSLKILSDNKWTRASSVCLSYFMIAKKEFEVKLLSEKDFTEVINCLSNIAPIDSVSPLTIYLEELNSIAESGENVSTAVVLAVIKSLGAIGDKSAFDSLLAVTYLNYPEEVLSAAREALAGLRW